MVTLANRIVAVIAVTNVGVAKMKTLLNGWEWLVYVACFAIVLAVADMNMDKALGILN
jgi:type IV secretory pathway VirB2 component (pilin)